MKKAILTIIFAIMLVVIPVQAKKNFEFNFKTDQPRVITIIEKLIEGEKATMPVIKIADNNTGFGDKYVTSRATLDMNISDEKIQEIKNVSENPNAPQVDIKKIFDEIFYTELTAYDLNGKATDSTKLARTVIFSMSAKGEYLYAYTLTFDPSILMETPTEDEIIEFNDVITLNFIKLDQNLKIKSSLDITNEVWNKLYNETDENETSNNVLMTLLISILPKAIGYDNITFENNEVALLLGPTHIVTADLDLKAATVKEFNEENFNKHFPDLYKGINNIIKCFEDMENFENTATEEELTVYGNEIGAFVNSNDKYTVSSGVAFDIGYTPYAQEKYGLKRVMESEDSEYEDSFIGVNAYLELYDKNNKQLWSKENSEYVAFINTKLTKEYITTIGVKFNIPKIDEESGEMVNLNDYAYETHILIYDFEGNLVQTIKNETLILGLSVTDTSFITTNIMHIEDLFEKLYEANQPENTEDISAAISTMNISDIGKTIKEASQNKIQQFLSDFSINNIGEMVETPPIELLLSTNNEVYNIATAIKTDITGKGTITVDKSAIVGKVVSFATTANNGYKLESIKVIDEKGNEMKIENNSFVMPDSEVTIKAVFSVDNPNTSDIAIAFIILIVVTCGISLIVNRRKMNI